jgi:hypothetical protein
MPYTPYDYSVLSSRNFLTDYAQNKTRFVEAGKIVYQTLLTHGSTAPTPIDLERPFGVALQTTTIFKTICRAKPHAPQKFYPTFAFALSRYIITLDWTDVIKP